MTNEEKYTKLQVIAGRIMGWQKVEGLEGVYVDDQHRNRLLADSPAHALRRQLMKIEVQGYLFDPIENMADAWEMVDGLLAWNKDIQTVSLQFVRDGLMCGVPLYHARLTKRVASSRATEMYSIQTFESYAEKRGLALTQLAYNEYRG